MIKDYFIAFFCAFVAALLATPVVARFAAKWKLMDLPDARKVHARPTPRVGGIAFAISTLVMTLVVLCLDTDPHKVLFSDNNSHIMIGILLGASGFLFMGLADDIWNLRSRNKLMMMALISAGVCWWGVRIDHLTLDPWGTIQLGWMSYPVTILWIVGITVSINFVDGLDGLAAGISAIAAGMIALTAGGGISQDLVSVPAVLIVVPALALSGSLLGFLVFNYHPAKIFMGDCGSLFTGFLLATLGMQSSHKTGSSLGIIITAVALGVPIIDTLFTFVRRGVLQRRSVFAAERGHIHHHLLNLGLKQQSVVLLLLGVSAASAFGGMLLLFRKHPLVIVAFLVLPLLLLFLLSGHVNFGKLISAVRRNMTMGREDKNYRDAFEKMQLRFATVDDFDKWWAEVCAAADAMDVIRIALPVPGRTGATNVLEWERPGFDGTEMLRLVIPIRQRRIGGPLRANVEVDAGDSLEAASKRLTFFARLLEEYSIASIPEKTTRGSAHAKEPRSEQGDGSGNGHMAPAARLPAVRVAIVHDFLYTYAGAERVLEQMLHVLPHADLFSLFDFLPADQRDFIMNKPVQTSFIQRLPMAKKKHRSFLPLMPLAIEQLDVSKYDIVVSSSYAVAKGVITRPDQLHICYCHSPIRYAWDLQHQYLREAGIKGVKSLLPRAILHYIRNWDARSANSVDLFLTNSDFVGKRIQKFYRRNSKALHPPVDTEEFNLEAQKEDFYLTASRFVPYKRIDLIVEAFSYLPDRRLFVVGEGPMFDKIAAKAGPNVKLLGYQTTERLKNYMQRAKGFVFAAEEDFGIVPVEAQACGTPVIAFARGGNLETVVDGETGVFFEEQTAESLVHAIQRFEKMKWDARAIRKHAEGFSIPRFRMEFGDIVERAWASFRNGRQLGFDPLLRALEVAQEADELRGNFMGREDEPRKPKIEIAEGLGDTLRGARH